MAILPLIVFVSLLLSVSFHSLNIPGTRIDGMGVGNVRSTTLIGLRKGESVSHGVVEE